MYRGENLIVEYRLGHDLIALAASLAGRLALGLFLSVALWSCALWHVQCLRPMDNRCGQVQYTTSETHHDMERFKRG